jgi:hypothetical protein
MKFDRSKKHQIINYYEHFFMKNDWTLLGIPFGIGDWYLLVGLGPSSVEYPLQYAAIYVDEQDGEHPVYIYVEATEDQVMKLIVGASLGELLPAIPERALSAINHVTASFLSIDR